MRHPKGAPKHKVAPAEFHDVPVITGSAELDRVIQANPNKDMERKLKNSISGGQGTHYGPLTGYSGYHNYHGDT